MNELERIQALREKDRPLYGRINPTTDIEGSLSNVVQDTQQNLNLALANSPRAKMLEQQTENQNIYNQGIAPESATAQLDTIPMGQLQQTEGLPPVTQTFGQKSKYDVFSGGVNYGVDFGVKTGTPVGLPPGEWRVVDAYGGAVNNGYIGNKTNNGYGNSVLVKNTKTGESLRLSHLSQVGVKSGQIIPGGTVIGTSGKSGNVTGDHLDVEYRNSSGKLNDVLQTPYSRYLVGRGGSSSGRGGGFADFISSLGNKATDVVKNVGNAVGEWENRKYNERGIYGDQTSVNKDLSQFGLSKGVDYRGLQNYLREKNLPGQVLTGQFADWQEKSKPYQISQKMSGGEPITKEDRETLSQEGISMVGGMVEPIKSSGRGKMIDDLIAQAKKYGSAEEFWQRMGRENSDALRKKGIKGRDAIFNFWEDATKDVDKTPIMDSLNPTGSVFVDYNPKARAEMKLAPNMTTVAETTNRSPEDFITIYRGATSNQKNIVPGDFITTNYDVAKSYTGTGNVLSKKVKLGDILDDLDDPLKGEESIYRPGAWKEIADIFNKAKGLIKK